MSKVKPNPKKRVADIADVASQKDARTGRFLPGNSGFGGRPKGARSKLTTEFFEDFYRAWQEHGAEALKKVAESSPRDFVRAAAMLMPKEFELRSPLNELTDAELADLITAVKSLITAGPALTPAGRE
jgi:hypothetical protein